MTSCNTHKIDQQETDFQTSEIRNSRFQNKHRQIQVTDKITGRTSNTGYEWYIGSQSTQSPDAPEEVSVIRPMHDTC